MKSPEDKYYQGLSHREKIRYKRRITGKYGRRFFAFLRGRRSAKFMRKYPYPPSPAAQWINPESIGKSQMLKWEDFKIGWWGVDMAAPGTKDRTGYYVMDMETTFSWAEGFDSRK